MEIRVAASFDQIRVRSEVANSKGSVVRYALRTKTFVSTFEDAIFATVIAAQFWVRLKMVVTSLITTAYISPD